MFDIQEVKRNVSNKWNKATDHEPSSEPAPSVQPSTVSPSRAAATIGPSIQIKGELSGEENLIIEGNIEGTINLKDNDLTIGKNGKIKANVFARTISIDGHLRGDLHGQEKVVIRQSGNVRGNIVAPRVTLEDGAQFKGSIDMDPKSAPTAQTSDSAKSASSASPDKPLGNGNDSQRKRA